MNRDNSSKLKLSRRSFVALIVALLAIITLPIMRKNIFISKIIQSFDRCLNNIFRKSNTQKSDSVSNIYIVKNGTPQQNVAKVIDMMGGIEHFIGINDVVILKPNCQWWNQGRTNLAAIKGFIDLVLNIPNFKGEVLVAENHHFMDDSLPEQEKDNIRGWTHISEINGDIEGKNHSMNTMIELFHEDGYTNVSKIHWRDGGPKFDNWGNGQNGGIVDSIKEGDGYVWSDMDYTFSILMGLKKWKVKMTYPVFTSPFSGLKIDFKNGVYEKINNELIFQEDKPLKFINFAVLNDHGNDTGITSSIKNYMGITDLSCGYWGEKPEGYYNVHACGGKYFKHAKAGPLAYFMKKIRKADLNIVTADRVGWGSRTDISKSSHAKAILAGTDPVSLDYYGSKHFIYPASRNKSHHDPDNPGSPIRKFLDLALEVLTTGTIDEENMSVHISEI